jgi:hypothetical protein
LITSKLQQGIFKMLFYKSGIEEIWRNKLTVKVDKVILTFTVFTNIILLIIQYLGKFFI